MTAQESVLSAALGYAARGWRVVPLHTPTGDSARLCSCGRPDCDKPGKHPRVKAWPETATTDEATIRRWWDQWPNANVGIVCGARSDLLVVDVDGPEGRGTLRQLQIDNDSDCPITPKSITGRGEHILFKNKPGVKNEVRFAPGLDVRTEGGLIVAPPSVHCSGAVYEWDALADPAEVPVADAPDWLIGLMREASTHKARDPIPDGGKIAEGQRNDTLFRVGCAQRRYGLGKAAILAALEVHNRDHCEPPLSDDELEGIAERAASYAPASDAELNPVRLKLGSSKAITNGSGSTQAGEEEKSRQESAKMSDDALSLIWANKERDRFMFVDGGQWWRWNESSWRYCGPDIAETEVILFLRRMQKVHPDINIVPYRVNSILSLARADLGPVMQDDMNPRKDWIPLSNGMYDIGTGSLFPHSPDNRNTYCLRFPFEEGASCPRWMRHLDETLIDSNGMPCQEWIGAVQEWFGYCLIADHNRAQTVMFWAGEGGNGKGVATRVLEKLVGNGQHIAVAVEQLHEPYHRAALVGKLVGFVNEPSMRAMEKNGDTVKAITGGDEIQARNPSERVFSFRPTIRLLVSCNDLPSTKDLSHGYFRRVLLIQFRAIVPEDKKDTNLDSVLEAELPGIFNWAVVGLKRFQARGYKFDQLPESNKLKADYQKAQDVVEQFVDDACMVGEEYESETSSLYSAFRSWCHDSGLKDPMDKRRFGMRIAAVLKTRHIIGGSKVTRYVESIRRRWVGVRLTEEWREVEIGRPDRLGL